MQDAVKANAVSNRPLLAGCARCDERWIDADDGWRLSVVDGLPAGPVRAVAVVGHAMMVDRRTVARAAGTSLARTLVEAGFRVLVPDLRGHGRSGPTVADAGSWSYDELVRDVGCYVALARRLEPTAPLFLVGNSLFGHVSLAYLGLHPDEPVDGLVCFAVNIWNRRWTASWCRLWVKRAVVVASLPVVWLFGYLPCRHLHLGTTDEPSEYWRAMIDTALREQWASHDGHDYAAALGNIRCPLLHVLSDGDRLLAHPDDASRYTARFGGRREVIRLGDQCSIPALAGLRPGHVEMVSNPVCEPLWRHAAAWMTSVVGLLDDGQVRR